MYNHTPNLGIYFSYIITVVTSLMQVLDLVFKGYVMIYNQLLQENFNSVFNSNNIIPRYFD